MTAGAAAGSAALLGFGMDSFVEPISGRVMIWRFRGDEDDACARERREARALRLVADSKQTLGCLWMSAAVLVGLGLNQLFGLWQAEPVIGLAIGAWLVKKGREAMEHGKLCAC